MKQRRFIVPIEVTVLATDMAGAEAEASNLLTHAMETANDLGIFESSRLHETSDTIQVTQAGQ